MYILRNVDDIGRLVPWHSIRATGVVRCPMIHFVDLFRKMVINICFSFQSIH